LRELTKEQFMAHFDRVFVEKVKRVDMCYNSEKHLKDYFPREQDFSSIDDFKMAMSLYPDTKRIRQIKHLDSL